MNRVEIESGREFRYPFALGLLALFGAVFLLYSFAFGHNFLFDEESIILKNPLIRKLEAFPELFRYGYFYQGLPELSWTHYYRPLTSLTFAVDFRFWSINPLGYNLTNTMLHFAAAGLLFGLLRRALQDMPAAFMAALAWAVHPIHTEAVTYIASRGDLLGAIFVLLALHAFRRGSLLGAAAAQALAVFCKESTILIPALLLAWDVTFRRGSWLGRAGRLAPSVGVTLAYLLFRKFACPVPLGPPENDPAQGILRVFSMGPLLLSYLQAIVLPEEFKFSLWVTFAERWSDPRIAVTLAIGVLFLAAWLTALRRRGAAFFGLSVFFLCLGPYLQFVHFYPQWAEHYLYSATLGLAFVLGAWIRVLRTSPRKRILAGLLALYAATLGFWSYRTWQRNMIYNDTEKYFEHLARSDSRYAYFGFQNLGRIALEAGRPEDAIVPLQTAIAIQPESDVTHNLLGLYYFQKEVWDRALHHFEQADRTGRSNPIYRINMTYIYLRQERYPEAVEVLRAVQTQVPDFSSVYVNLMTAYELLGEPGEAAAWLEKGIEATAGKEWENVTLRMAAARYFYRQGQDASAREHLDEILRRTPAVFWYADAARLLTGALDEEEFGRRVETQYVGFGRIARNYVLMSYVLLDRPERIRAFFERHRDDLTAQAANQPLFRKELRRAEEASGVFLGPGAAPAR